MQKKIIALAIASALTVPALAFAEATVYGQMNMSVDMVNDGVTGTSTSANQLNSNTSRLGLKGSEDLGGGLSVVWGIEGKLTPDTGAGFSFDRNNSLGLKSADMGTVLVGKLDTPYKSATRRMDLFGDGIADNRGNQSTGGAVFNTSGAGAINRGMGDGNDARLSNVLAYSSPSMSGLSVSAATVFGAELNGAAAPIKKGSALSLAGMYEQGPIYATVAYQTIKLGSAGTGDLDAANFGAGSAADDKGTAFKVGGSYSMDAITANAVFEQTKWAPVAGGETKGTNLYFSGKFALSATDAAKLAYAKLGETKTGGVANGDDASQITVGYDHGMSKTTTVYALYTKVTNNTLVGANPSALSFGMKHAF